MKKLIALSLAVLMILTLFAGCGSKSGSAKYPTKNINIICSYGAGGTTDLCIRGLVDAIPDGTLPKGVNMLVNNVAGAAGLVGAQQFVNSPSDGYTLGIINTDMVIHEVKGNTDISYDQFTPLACLMQQPNLVLVNTSSSFTSLEDLIDYAKANPGALKVANSGDGGLPAMCAQAIEKALGLSFKYVNYDSDGACVTGVVAGEADVTMVSAAACVGQVQAGTVVPVAVSDGSNRMESYADVPAWGEVYDELKDVNILTWIYLVTKNDTDPEIVDYLQKTFAAAHDTDKFVQTQQSFKIEPTTFAGTEAAMELMAAQRDFYQNLINN